MCAHICMQQMSNTFSYLLFAFRQESLGSCEQTQLLHWSIEGERVPVLSARDTLLSGSICLSGYWGIICASVCHLCSDQSLPGGLLFPEVHKLVLHSCLSCSMRAGAQREVPKATPPSPPSSEGQECLAGGSLLLGSAGDYL